MDRFHRDIARRIAVGMARELVKSAVYLDVNERVYDETEGSKFLSDEDRSNIVEETYDLLKNSIVQIEFPVMR